ncbi:uncharacterized protein [Halyomorpha halys]|uniref:uncharacterized protein n=1 Tax=Halyomorpha halys TaxID=286706 RepID=UPI0034D38931
MNFLDPINVLEKVVPEPPAGSAIFWPAGRDYQSQVGRTGLMQKMFPTRMHHLSMAAGLLAITVLLLIAAFTLNYDLCVKVTSDMHVLGRYIQPSDHNSGFPQVIADIMATIVILIAIFCVYRWSSYPKAPAGIQKSIDHVNAEPPEMVHIMCKTFFVDLINVEIENFLVYFLLMVLFAVLASTDAYLPETIFWPKSPEDLQHMEVPTFCFIGFGIFGWFKPVIIVIVGGFAILCAVSVINLYQDYLHLKRNQKVPVAGINEYVDGQNNAILLNVRFSNMTETENQDNGTAQLPKDTGSIYVPAVEEVNHSDAHASDMKTV